MTNDSVQPEEAEDDHLHHLRMNLFSQALSYQLFPNILPHQARGHSLLWRVAVIWAVSWLPLLVLSAFETGWDELSDSLPFFIDFGTHVRFLIALPMFMLAGVFVEPRIDRILSQFQDNRLVKRTDRERFADLVASSQRLARSRIAEGLILAYVVGAAVMDWRVEGALSVANWQVMETAAGPRPTPAGWWMAYVGIPLYHYFVLNWIWRALIWTGFIWRVSRLELNIEPLHPDRVGGLGFLSLQSLLFSPFIFAFAAVYAGVLAKQMMFEGATVSSIAPEIAVLCFAAVFITQIPAFAFTDKLILARSVGILQYSSYGRDYARRYTDRWLGPKGDTREMPLGSEDVQSLASIIAAYENLHRMRFVVYDNSALIITLASVLLPMLTLVFIEYTPSEIMDKIGSAIF